LSEENDALHDTAALRSLAMSINNASDDEAANEVFTPTDGQPAESTDDFFEAAAEGKPAEVEEVLTVASEEREELVRVEKSIGSKNGVALARIQTLQRTIQMRKIGIPILSAIAGILFLISVATLYQAYNALPEQIDANPLLQNAGLFAAISIFLGVSLLAGVGFFAFEISRYNASIKKIEAAML